MEAKILNNTNDYKVYPNPVKDILYINNHNQLKKIEIYNILGEKVIEKEHPNNTIPVHNIREGLYTVKMILRNGDYIIKKITIQH